jgi:hypothetical protein
VDRVVAPGQERPAVDRVAPLFSLPRLCGPAPDGIAAGAPYLACEEELRRAWSQRLGPRRGLRVGLGWQGNPGYVADGRRSPPLAGLLPALRVPGVELFSLQKGAGREQLSALPPDVRVTDLGAQLDDRADAFVDTAAVLSPLDLVVTSDTALPHLAGAMGRPTWLLLAHVPDWRWGLHGDVTPFYPTMRLYRQSAPGDWGELGARVAQALGARAAEGGTT